GPKGRSVDTKKAPSKGLFRSLEPDIELVEHDAVRIIEDIAHETVAELEPVEELVGHQYAVAHLLSKLGFEPPDRRAQPFVFNPVAHHEQVEPSVPLAHKDAREHDELQCTSAAQARGDVLGARGCVEKQVLHGGEVREFRVETP